MKRLAFLIALTSCASASAQGYRTPCCEGSGPIRNWPGVCQARYEASLCHDQMMAVIARGQMELNYSNPAVTLRPYYQQASAPVATPAPAPPIIPSAAPLAPMSPAAPATVSPPVPVPTPAPATTPLPSRPR